MFGRFVSKVYLARPVVLSGPSIRCTRVPRIEQSLGSGQATLAMSASSAVALGRAERVEHRVGHAVIGPAATEISAESADDLFARRLRVSAPERLARHHEAGRAEAALL